ncbi:MAG TPA: alkyl sulfatase dimerization domain-containing protein [Steroidobacteraceae bacterium]|nr:alkyl sulfatase dimerization domain-containing protein [Steroidobacteraceae bacterium]
MSAPPLAQLVLSGDAQTEAVAITRDIFMAKDVSNAYLLTTGDGDLLVNTGFNTGAERTRRLFAPHRSGPLRKIIVTQSHGDHYGGVPTLREPGTQIITECRFLETRRYYQALAPYFGPRTGKLWGSTIKKDPGFKPPDEIVPDVTVDRQLQFELGGRRFVLLSTPGGETIDSLTVWLPEERVAFIGNLLGPVFMSMPFLCTLRGDKPRSVLRYLDSLDTVRKLGAQILITGHGDPIRGAARIRADLDKLHEAVAYVDGATIAGMNAGKDVHTLMREIKLPEALKIGEFHGKVSWAVRTIWEEYSGWFHYDSTTSLYGVPRSSIDADLAELSGGAAALAARARAYLGRDQPLPALHLLEVALGAEPSNREALSAKKSALQALLTASGGTNLSEVMWLRSEIAAIEAALIGS